MAKSEDTYGDLVQRLEQVVKRLEGGELSLEDSLKAFEEGIGLVRKGERLLTDAEKRIEQHLVEEGEPKAVPLNPPAPSTAPAAAPSARKSNKPPTSGSGGDDDVPF